MKISFTILLAILWSNVSWTQTQTPIYLSQTIPNANSKGYYRYLPADYAASNKNYPLIIWLHGGGSIGQGNATDLPKILNWGIPRVINEGNFPSSFTVNGVSHSFIVISPQFIAWPNGVNISAIIDFVSNNYRVDASRIYLVGASAGGGGVWDYASRSISNSDRLAAIVPFCGTLSPNQTLASRIAASKLPVWAFHNTYDRTVAVANSRNWVNYINSYVPTPNPAAKLTEFPAQSTNTTVAHDCWTLGTSPTYKPAGINIYEWLLQYKTRGTVVNAAPVARAGNDASVVLPTTVTLNGSSSTDADGTITAYRWRKLSGPASHSFSDSTAANTIVGNLSPGSYQFELRVTDNSGLTGTDNITVAVHASTVPAVPSPDAITKTFRVNIFGGTTPYGNAQWNNWNVASSLTSARFNYEDGTASNVNAILSASALIADNGANYAADATVCPPQVLRYTSVNTSYRTLTFYGMTNTKSYNLEFYASRASTGNSTAIKIGNVHDTISTDNNMNDAARFTNIVPDNDGRIIVTISRIGVWNYLSGFVVTENSSSPPIASAAGFETSVTALAQDPLTEFVNLVVYPNPTTNSIYVNIPAGFSGPYKVTLANINGQQVLQKTGTKGYAGFADKIDLGGLPKGIYLLQLSIQNKNMSSTIVKQ